MVVRFLLGSNRRLDLSILSTILYIKSNIHTHSQAAGERNRQRDQSQLAAHTHTLAASANFRISKRTASIQLCVRLVSTTTNFIISLCSHCRSPYSSLASFCWFPFFFANFRCECTNSSLKRVRRCSFDLSTLLLNFIAHHQRSYFGPPAIIKYSIFFFQMYRTA